MRKIYIMGHWGLTLLIAPLTSQAIEYMYRTNRGQVAALLEIYPVTLMFSIIFSLPTFLVYLACFYLLSHQDVPVWISKFILIAVSVSGVFITQTIIKGSMSQDIITAYSVTAVITGLVLRLKDGKMKKPGNRITA